MSVNSILDALSSDLREKVENEIEKIVNRSVKRERDTIVKHIKKRSTYWAKSSRTEKAISRLARDINQNVHNRVKRDKERHE